MIAPKKISLRWMVFADTALSYWRIGWKQSWIYRRNTLLSLIGAILALALQLAVWAFLTKDGSLGGYSKHSSTAYFTMMYLLGIVLSPGCDIWLSRRIINGDIVLDMLKPQNPLFFVPFEQLSANLHRLLIGGLPVMAGLALLYGFSLSPSRILAVMPVMTLSYVFWVAMEFCLGSACFRTNAYWGVASLKSLLLMLLTGRLLPLEFYPNWLAASLDKNPFAIAYYHVARGALGLDSGRTLLSVTFWQLLFAAAACWLAMIFWNTGLRKLHTQGG
ncbi:MAG: ABC-2 family transporter protein [Elusimicrobiales bacterium]|nr:ABC-2 family transporter protein [Elusimicrobiales bacterium]